MREHRIKISNPELDNKEMEWWDNNAATIEKIWALNFELQKVIRLPYLKKMKDFFTSNAKHLPIKILEVGCGSGWVCRLVADENFNIIGTDFSTGQLTIAKIQAKLYGKEDYCTYELADASSFQKNIDGVVIHALLHHLSSQELTVFFEQLSMISPGTKVFMYEPVFIKKQEGPPSLRDKILNRIITKLKKFSVDRAKTKGIPNKELGDEMEIIYEAAKKKRLVYFTKRSTLL